MSTLPTLVSLNDKLDDILDTQRGIELVLREIRDRLSANSTDQEKPTIPSGNSSAVIDLEQPKQLTSDPGSYVLKFTKHKDKRLDQLDDGMLIWLLRTWKPKQRPEGGLYYEDAILWDCVRQFWHTRQGTLIGKVPDMPKPPMNHPPQTTTEEEPY